MIAAVGGLALAGAPKALADPIPVAPAEDAAFTGGSARSPSRRRSTPSHPCALGQMDFRVSSINDPSGVLPGPDDFSGWFRCQRSPTGRVRLDANWPNRPGNALLAGGLPQLRPGRPELLQRDQIADHRAAGAAHPQTPGR